MVKQRMLVVEPDVDLREVVELALQEAGYPTVGVSDIEMAQAILRLPDSPWVVLLGYHPLPHLWRREQEHTLLGELANLPLNAWVLMSGLPEQAPKDIYNPHTHRLVPVLAMPFSMDELLRVVQQAAAYITQSGAAHVNSPLCAHTCTT
jgi:DNA-binding NtrC family response regulator